MLTMPYGLAYAHRTETHTHFHSHTKETKTTNELITGFILVYLLLLLFSFWHPSNDGGHSRVPKLATIRSGKVYTLCQSEDKYLEFYDLTNWWHKIWWRSGVCWFGGWFWSPSSSLFAPPNSNTLVVTIVIQVNTSKIMKLLFIQSVCRAFVCRKSGKRNSW